MGLRISARLDDASSGKLLSLQKITGRNMTDVLSAALACYYEQQLARANDGNRRLLALSGLFDGPADISTNYKDEFDHAIERKLTGHR